MEDMLADFGLTLENTPLPEASERNAAAGFFTMRRARAIDRDTVLRLLKGAGAISGN